MPEGVILVPCSVQGRGTSFWQCLSDLERPPGWRVAPKISRGNSVAANRNLLAQWALDEGYEWQWWLDDDLEFQPDTLRRLSRHQVSAVVACCRRRRYPFEVLWLDAHPEGGLQWVVPQDPALGLQRIRAATSGALLTHRSVLERVGPPWWTLGQYARDEWQDDIWFCDRLAQEGIPLYGDPSVCVGHNTEVTIWPVWHEGQWMHCLARGGEPFAALPTLPPTPGVVAGMRR